MSGNVLVLLGRRPVALGMASMLMLFMGQFALFIYPILPPDRMPRVHVRIVESGAPMGGIGEPGLPGVPPAVVNAASVLTGQRIRSLPLSKLDLKGIEG